ncbi:type 1 glutamine amidotransferase [Parasphingorhabdus pacifica]
MSVVRILVVQPSMIDPVGNLGDWLTAAGAEISVISPEETPVPADLSDYQALVVLGGGMGALDDVEYPWLAGIRTLLSHAVANQVPVLAICLGAQLLAAATGGQVRTAANGPETGTLLVAKRDAAGEDPLLAELPLTPDVMQFHQDEVTALPPSAKLLASSPHCENQAFRVGDCAYGLQFHIETTTPVVQEWVRTMPELAAAAREGHWDADHLDRFHAELPEVWQPLAQRFVRMAATPAEERRTNRFLPLV